MPKLRAQGTSLGPSSFPATPNRRSRLNCDPSKHIRPGLEALEGRLLMSAARLTSHAEIAQYARRLAAQPAPSPAETTVANSAAAAPVATAAAVTSPMAGDANADGAVDILDLNVLLANYNKPGGIKTWAQGDFTGDGAVTIFDLNSLLSNYGKTTGSSGGSGTISPAQGQPPANLTWSGPLVITKGGTYTGNWQSTSAGTPAVQVRTTEPVTILNANIKSRGSLIASVTNHTNITVKNSRGWALNPNVAGQLPGRFIDTENFDNLDVENNTLVGTAGIEMGYYMGNGTAAQTVKILKNNALNIDGRYSDGNGGFQTSSGAYDDVQFAQFNHCFNLVGAEIAWNQVVNQPGQSRVEDNISVYISSGTAASPILIHDNYIQGAYPVDAAGDNSFSGGGIMLSDGTTGSASTATGNVSAYNNIIISTSNYGLAISSGHNNSIYNNTVISSGLLPTGQRIAGQNVGIYVWNSIGDPNWGNNQEYGNTIGWNGPSGSRNDTWTPSATGKTGDTALAGPITLATELSYYNIWAQKVSAAGFTIGAT